MKMHEVNKARAETVGEKHSARSHLDDGYTEKLQELETIGGLG